MSLCFDEWYDDPAETDAICRHGIIFTDANQKRPVVRRFLEHHHNLLSSPRLIIVADDSLSNCQSVFDSLHDCQLVELLVCHFFAINNPQSTDEKEADTKDENDLNVLLLRHLKFFLAHGWLCSDMELGPERQT